MQKIKKSILENLLKKCTGSDLDLYLHLCQFQNDFGQVFNVHYRTTSIKLKFSFQCFYDSLYSLENKGFICLKSSPFGTFNVKILDNIFQNSNDYKVGYLDLKAKPFFNPSFYDLTITLKRAVVRISMQMYNDKLTVGMDKIREYCNDGRSTDEKIIEQFEEFYSIEPKGKNIYTFRPLNEAPSYKDTGLFKLISFKIAMMLQKHNITYTVLDLFDIYYIFKTQYKKFNRILSKLHQTIFEKRSLEPALINSLVNNR